MKFGMRKPSISKSIKARTTGKLTRTAKSAVNPLYCKRGIGYINNPEKAIYNKVYKKTTFGVKDVLSDSKTKINNTYSTNKIQEKEDERYSKFKLYRNIILTILISILVLCIFALVSLENEEKNEKASVGPITVGTNNNEDKNENKKTEVSNEIKETNNQSTSSKKTTNIENDKQNTEKVNASNSSSTSKTNTTKSTSTNKTNTSKSSTSNNETTKTSSNSTKKNETNTDNSKSGVTSTTETTNSKIVYITETGEKYHSASCSYLKKSKIEISLDKAKSTGYTACSRCKP